MIRLISVSFLMIFISCNTEQRITKSKNTSVLSAGKEQVLQITAKLISVEEAAKKFKVLAIIKNETNITSFSKGDTVSLYPNFIRKEGEALNTKSSENEHMASLQSMQPESSFNATIKIRGKGDKRYGLIMSWE